MPFGIFVNIKTSLNRDSTFRYNEVIPENNYALPIEVSNLNEIAIGFKKLNSEDEMKIKVFKIKDYIDNSKTEIDMLKDFYNLFLTLAKKSLIKNDMYLVGYDIKKYVLPSLIKLLVVKYQITEYNELPDFIKIKELKPWDVSNVIDIKDELSFGGYYVNLDYFKFFNNVLTDDIEDELKLFAKFV